MFVNVPAEIRSYEYSGRTESDAVAPKSPFNSQQKQVLIDSLHSKGSNKFEFYINSAVKIDDEARTESLCFGNPNPENCVLVLIVFDSDGKMIYRSLGLKSGAELNNIKLFYELPYGLQEVTAAVNAYDGQTNEKIGTRYAEIKLAVGVDENGK